MLPYDVTEAGRPLPERLRLDTKHIAVTGAASGLGAAMTRGFLESGALVTMIDCDENRLGAAATALGEAVSWRVAYSASKGADANLVRQAAVDLAPDGIRVSGIAPGPFFTNIGGPGPIPSEIEKAWADTVLLRRMAHGREIRGLAALLASDASSFMTGAIYPVDGGVLAGSFTIS